MGKIAKCKAQRRTAVGKRLCNYLADRKCLTAKGTTKKTEKCMKIQQGARRAFNRGYRGSVPKY